MKAVKEMDEEWGIRGRLTFSFVPQKKHTQTKQKFPALGYYMSPHSYGYVTSAERCAKLGKPDDFPITSSWVYQMVYLLFYSYRQSRRAFFPYSVNIKSLETDASGRRSWQLLAKEEHDYLKHRIIKQLRRDSWEHNGLFKVAFQGIDSVEKETNLVEFLFTKNLTESSSSI